MRIQHNIMAMSAYRNYSNNTSAVAKNLERLSSGYKINRAGDDAAGLAISEKMRAQITGLNAAQKNVKDGISLVKTSEGAMQEIQDMLNRMDYLATQSANGTYQDDVDREALQNEVEQLRKEINRIAESANFNGIKLLDGSLEAGGGGTTIKGIDRIINQVLGAGEDPVVNTGVKTILDGGSNQAQATKFDVDFTGLTAAKGDGTAAGAGTAAVYKTGDVTAVTLGTAANKITIGGKDIAVTGTTTVDELVTALSDTTDGVGTNWTVAKDGDDITFTAKAAGAKTLAGATQVTEGKAQVAASATVTVAAANENNASFAGLIGIDLSTTTNGNGTDFSWTANKEADGSYTITITSTATDPTQDVTVGGVNLSGGSAATTAVYKLADAADAITAATSASATLTVAGKGYTVTETDLDKQLDQWATKYNADAVNDKWTASVSDDKKSITFTAKTPGAIGGNGPATGDIPTGTTVVTAGADGTAAQPGEDSQITFKIGNTTLATDVTVAGDAAAKDIATAIFGALANANATKIGNNTYKVTDGGNGKLTFELTDAPTATNIQGNFDWDVTMKDATGKFSGNHTAGTTVTQQGQVGAAGSKANTVFNMTVDDIKDGTKITIDGTTVTLAVGADSKFKDVTGAIDLTSLDTSKTLTAADLNKALGKISEGFKDGTTNFIVGVNDKSNGDTNIGLTVHKKDASTQTYDTKEKLAEVFSISTAGTGKPLTLQIGDTSESFNQMDVNIKDMHTSAMGTEGGMRIADINIGSQEGAAKAVNVIKDAINYVSSVRGDLGAIQNRLEHTQNNLSVMAENITDAESSIRDTDIAEEMMAYTKNNILVQSAQAMLAQANQVPQGVLQLLG